MPHEIAAIRTPDGDCPTHVLTPDGRGPWPAAIVYMDGLGMRPTLVDLADRLARHGYVVLLPDLFHRFGRYAPLDPATVLAGDIRASIGPMLATTGNRVAAADTSAFVAWLDTRADVAGDRIGAVGFCMGGGMALTAAALHPHRIVAAASFHGGNLATDDAASPHRLAPAMRAEIYVAGADQDASYPPEMAARLEDALTAAAVTHRCEIYASAAHGWMVPDLPSYDPAAAERGWRAMLDLFDRALR